MGQVQVDSCPGEQDGLTLVELLIALFIVMVVFAGLASTFISVFSGVRQNEARVQAVALANETIEAMSATPWSRLGLLEDDADVPEGTFEGEVVVLIPKAQEPEMTALTPAHLTEDIDRDGRSYTVRRWVTWVEEDVGFDDDGGPEGRDLKRMVVIVEWQQGGRDLQLRTEGLRSPNPGESEILEIEIIELGGGTVGTLDPSVDLNQDDPDPDVVDWTASQALTVVVDVGELQSSLVISFTDRTGTLRTVTAPDAEGQEIREIPIPSAFTYRHGPTAFTATATGPDGELATAVDNITFFQELSIREPIATQAGSGVINICAGTGVLVDDVFVDAQIEGLTGAEAIAGDLYIEILPNVSEAITGFVDEDDPDDADQLWRLMGQIESTAYGGEYRAVIEPDDFTFQATVGDPDDPEDDTAVQGDQSFQVRVLAFRVDGDGNLVEDELLSSAFEIQEVSCS